MNCYKCECQIVSTESACADCITKAKKSTDNLCDTCRFDFPSCIKAGHIKFGISHDNVIECSGFEQGVYYD